METRLSQMTYQKRIIPCGFWGINTMPFKVSASIENGSKKLKPIFLFIFFLLLLIFFPTELDLIRRDVQSRIWCTYRKGFVPLGRPQLTSDKGWGCMLRCGQMLLAQALLDLHLGRDWFWTPETRFVLFLSPFDSNNNIISFTFRVISYQNHRDPTYLKIVNRFEDSRKSPFSIHQIAMMGDSEDKRVGEWFGPNTVAQVLKYVLWIQIEQID